MISANSYYEKFCSFPSSGLFFSQVVGKLMGTYNNYWLPESFINCLYVTSIGIALSEG